MKNKKLMIAAACSSATYSAFAAAFLIGIFLIQAGASPAEEGAVAAFFR